MRDAFDLDRFVEAQAPVYSRVCAELRAGTKESHWMWFIFPQIRGLGNSPTAQRFSIASLDEAKAYLNHPVLGPRLTECTGLMLGIEGALLGEILGYPDDLKFRSSMTLFALASGGGGGVFQAALDKYCEGQSDPLTLRLVSA